jgi:hypothetical protein
MYYCPGGLDDEGMIRCPYGMWTKGLGAISIDECCKWLQRAAVSYENLHRIIPFFKCSVNPPKTLVLYVTQGNTGYYMSQITSEASQDIIPQS